MKQLFSCTVVFKPPGVMFVKEPNDGQHGQSAVTDVHRPSADKTVVKVRGQLVGKASSVMLRIVSDELARSQARLMLDLSTVTDIDGAGVDALRSAAALAGESDIAFCLVDSQSGPVGMALAAAELTDLFEIVDSPPAPDGWPPPPPG